MFGQYSATWQSAEALARRVVFGGNEAQREFWRKAQRLAAGLPFAEDVLTVHYCAFDRNTPFHVKAAMIGAIAYFVLPDDLIPDSIPVIGYADDAAVLAAAIKYFSSHIRPEHREAARLTLARLREEAPSRP
jgi:uncharacterized membrane protein YkvA (DUF1232 family)